MKCDFKGCLFSTESKEDFNEHIEFFEHVGLGEDDE